jgi:hypothetical protein
MVTTPPRNKENRVKKRAVKSIVPGIQHYPVLSRHLQSIEAWISPKRMSFKSLLEFIERTYEMKFKAETQSMRKDNRVRVSAESLEEFVIKAISSG